MSFEFYGCLCQWANSRDADAKLSFSSGSREHLLACNRRCAFFDVELFFF